MARRRSILAGSRRVAPGPRRRHGDGPKHRPGNPRPGRLHGSYGFGITLGVLLADDTAVRELDEALQVAERSGDDYVLGIVKYTLGIALVLRDADADRQRGLELLAQVHDMCLHERFYRSELPAFDFVAALEMARRGDRDGAIPVMRKAVNDLFQTGLLACGATGTAGLVESLLDRGTEGDVAEAQERDRPCGEPAGRRRFGAARHHAAAAARPAGPRPRRRCRLPRLSRSLPCDGDVAWLRRTHRDGPGDDVRAGICAKGRRRLNADEAQ